jgi:hypothetical protein
MIGKFCFLNKKATVKYGGLKIIFEGNILLTHNVSKVGSCNSFAVFKGG